MFEGQPKGLYALALANTGERFGYYTMLAIFVLFLKANFGLSPGMAGTIYSTFLALVYFLPFIGGILADKFGYGKMVTIGIIAMFAGYVLFRFTKNRFKSFLTVFKLPKSAILELKRLNVPPTVSMLPSVVASDDLKSASPSISATFFNSSFSSKPN